MEPTRPRRARWPWFAGAGVVVAIALGVFLIPRPDSPADAAPTTQNDAESQNEAESQNDATPQNNAEPTATPTPLTMATPTPAPITDDLVVEEARASDVAEQIITSTNEIAQRGDGGTAGLDLIATGFVQGELEAMAQDHADLGYRRVGEATVTQLTTISSDLSASPPTISLAMCVDVSNIDILDAAGNSLKDSLYDPGHPVKHIYGAEFIDGLWKIATHDIPDEQDCPAI